MDKKIQLYESPQIYEERLCRPDRKHMSTALDYGILKKQRVNGSEKTVVDARGCGTKPVVRNLIEEGLAANFYEIKDNGNMFGGVANSGTVWAALLGTRLCLDFCNVLIDGPRKTGLCRQIEPDTVMGRQIVLVDNWVGSGRSLLQGARIVARHGAEVAGAIVISAPTDFVSFSTPEFGDLPLRVLWPMDLLEEEDARRNDRT